MAAQSFPVIDAAIAATALAHGLTLVTRNTKDFVLTGGPILNPGKYQEACGLSLRVGHVIAGGPLWYSRGRRRTCAR